MGRPYVDELQELAETYRVASQIPDSKILADFLCGSAPLLLIGSGGAYSAARFMANAYEHSSGLHARLATPLEVISNPAIARDAKVLFVSAGGSNKDIVAALKTVIQAEPDAIMCLCASHKAKIIALSREVSYANSIVAPMGGKKDGFLALNSIISFTVIFSRACMQAYGTDSIPNSYADLTSGIPISSLTRTANSEFWSRSSITVLYGNSTQPASVDLESKSTESGLTSISLSDFRNFGHGRHHWLAKHSSDAAVLALSCSSNSKLAAATMKIIPANIPKLHFSFDGNFLTVSLRAIVTAFHLILQCADNFKIDPGRPGVPPFGSKIYSLGPQLAIAQPLSPNAIHRASIRKLRVIGTSQSEFKRIVARCEEDVSQISNVTYAGIILDYDGTIVGPSGRFKDIAKEVASSLNRLLRSGARISVCTGRGKSVHECLKKAINPKFHSSVMICFYNGSMHCMLNENPTNMRSTLANGEDSEAQVVLQALHSELTSIANLNPQLVIEHRPNQISISGGISGIAISPIGHTLTKPQYGCLKFTASSHSLDIIPKTTSKRNAIQAMRVHHSLQKDVEFLRFGDMGEWPGNDAELLDSQHGVSVRRSTASVFGGWNFAPLGITHTQALMEYLTAVKVKNGMLSWSPPNT